jgi:hypothetical protein
MPGILFVILAIPLKAVILAKPESLYFALAVSCSPIEIGS